jgi:hypothetical protein
MLDEIQSMVLVIPSGKPILALELILWKSTSRVLLKVLSLLGQRNTALVVNSQYWYYTKYNISEMTISLFLFAASGLPIYMPQESVMLKMVLQFQYP